MYGEMWSRGKGLQLAPAAVLGTQQAEVRQAFRLISYFSACVYGINLYSYYTPFSFPLRLQVCSSAVGFPVEELCHADLAFW